MFEVGVVATFESAHRLRGDFGPATRLHGHTYRLEVAVRGERLSEDGTLVDIALLRGAVDEVVASLHLRDLDEVPGLAGRNTTAERVAEHVAVEVGRRLADAAGCTGLGVRLWESPHAYAAHDVELGGAGR
jgi:6-pyruvoyltetrahydropterin/6-carboxytetrahydropterin synthase